MAEYKDISVELDDEDPIATAILHSRSLEQAPQRAKLAYSEWAYRVGDATPWERLSNHNQAGWLAAVRLIVDELWDDFA
jgi:hypothetical protein